MSNETKIIVNETKIIVNETKIIVNENMLYTKCPWCYALIQIERSQTNCCIFRHGIHIQRQGKRVRLLKQIHPHATREECENLVAGGSIIGCARPFKIDLINMVTKRCEYI
jgi:hypothetical protein